LSGLLVGPVVVRGAELSLHQGTVLFSALDGGPADEDGAQDGTLTVSSLDVQGNAELIVDEPTAHLEVAGDVSLAGSGSIHASEPLAAQGPDLEIHAGGAVRLVGNSSIRADGAGSGGTLRLCAGGDLELKGSALVSASSADLSGPGGSVRIEAGGQVRIAQPAGSVRATGTDGGRVEVVSCADDLATPAADPGASAIAVQGRIEAAGTAGAGGSVEIDARQGGVAFLPAVTTVDARGTTGGGNVSVTAGTSVTPAPPPTEPAATVTTGSPSDDPCDCRSAFASGLFIHGAVDRPTGLAGTTFKLSGELIRSSSPVGDWSWTLSDGRTFDGRTISVQFGAPGLYSATVTASNEEGFDASSQIGIVVFDPSTQAPPELDLPAKMGDVDGDGAITLADAHRIAKQASGLETLSADARKAADVDLDGKVTARDARLLGQAVAAGEALPRSITPDHGAPGTRVNLISPELLDPEALIQVRVGASDYVQSPLRVARGYGTFMIPLDPTTAGSLDVTPGPVEIRIVKDGQVVETHTFQVEAPEPLPADPKAELGSLLNEYLSLIDRDKTAVANALDFAGVSSDTRNVLLAAFDLAHQDMAAKVAVLQGLLDQPGGDQLAKYFFRFADANGYKDYRAKKDAAELIKTGGDLLSYGCDALLAAAAAALVFPGVGEVVDAGALFTWATECGSVAAAAEVAKLVSEIVADLDAKLRFKATPTAPQAGETVTLETDLEILGLDDICSGFADVGAHEVTQLIAKQAVARLFRTNVTLKAIADVLELISPETLDALTERLSAAAGDAITLTGLGHKISELASDWCDSLGLGIPLPIDIQPILSGPNPDVGTLTFPGGNMAQYMCSTDPNQSADSVSFTAEKEICDKPDNETATVACESKPVTITEGDNGNLNDDIFEVQIAGETVLTSSVPVRAVSTTVELAPGDHTVQMIGRAAPDGVGTYYISFSGATVIGGDPLTGIDLTPGVVKTFYIRVQ
jgi:PKD repeat protein